MNEKNLRIVLQVLVFCLPLTVFVIGDGLAAGLSFALFKIQMPFIVPDPSPFLITPLKEYGYIASGVIGGRTAIAYSLWYCGTALLAAALAIVIATGYGKAGPRYKNAAAAGTVLAGLLYLGSCIVQYGALLYGPSGYAIPVGIPLILFIGFRAYRMDRAPVTGETPGPLEKPADEPQTVK